MRKTLLGCFGVILVLALMVSLVANVFLSRSFIGGGGAGLVEVPDAARMLQLQPSLTSASGEAARIAQIDVSGIISSEGMGRSGRSMVSEVQASLQQALADPLVKGIVLRIDSPGGEVTASDAIYHAVKEADKVKPVVTLMESMAASGGYYIACGTRRIIAHPTTWTGSIGVIIQLPGYAQLMDKAGVKLRVFRSGAFKDSLGGHREMTPEEEKYTQEMVMQTYERFLGIVCAARKLSPEELRNGVADGRVISGADALKHKLVDQVGYAADAWQAAREAANAPDAEIVEYSRKSGLMESLGLGSRVAIPERIELDIADRLLPRLLPGRAYLLPASWAWGE